MIFATPQWRWTKDYQLRAYGFVRNTVYASELRSGTPVYVTVPVQLFPALDIMFPSSLREHITGVGVDFYLDRGEKAYVFGIATLDNKHFADLWSYTKSTLPPWASSLVRA